MDFARPSGSVTYLLSKATFSYDITWNKQKYKLLNILITLFFAQPPNIWGRNIKTELAKYNGLITKIIQKITRNKGLVKIHLKSNTESDLTNDRRHEQKFKFCYNAAKKNLELMCRKKGRRTHNCLHALHVKRGVKTAGSVHVTFEEFNCSNISLQYTKWHRSKMTRSFELKFAHTATENKILCTCFSTQLFLSYLISTD
jgi:hypothetical protein